MRKVRHQVSGKIRGRERCSNRLDYAPIPCQMGSMQGLFLLQSLQEQVLLSLLTDEVSEAEQSQFSGPQSFNQGRAGLDLICASEHTVIQHLSQRPSVRWAWQSRDAEPLLKGSCRRRGCGWKAGELWVGGRGGGGAWQRLCFSASVPLGGPDEVRVLLSTITQAWDQEKW